jgi:hypothetical protein
MAKQKPGQTFAEMLAELQESSVTQGKPIEVIEQRQYFLIICEGIRTEPNYFKYISNFLPKNLIETITIVGAGDNTINVVERAVTERDRRRNNKLLPHFDEVWAVFDKDDFPDERFNNAVILANNNGVNSAHSNQAFELWYVLHFQYLDTALTRNDYFRILSEKLKAKYEKNNEEIIKMLFERGNVVKAIEFADTLVSMNNGQSAAKSWPVTFVHKLVCKLLKYSNLEQFRDLNCDGS